MQTTICPLSHVQALFLTTRYTDFDDPIYLVSNVEQRTSLLPNPQIALDGNLSGFSLRHSQATGWEFVYRENHPMRRHFYGVCPSAGLRTTEVEVFTLTLHEAHQTIWLKIGSLRFIDRIYEHSDGNWVQVWEQGQSLEEQSAALSRRRKERMNKERRAFCRGVLAALTVVHKKDLPIVYAAIIAKADLSELVLVATEDDLMESSGLEAFLDGDTVIHHIKRGERTPADEDTRRDRRSRRR